MAKLACLNPDYTVARCPGAANGVPYELYDEDTARAKVAAAGLRRTVCPASSMSPAEAPVGSTVL
jgi:HEPN domain-containing protein